jgi:hypothetical protein
MIVYGSLQDVMNLANLEISEASQKVHDAWARLGECYWEKLERTVPGRVPPTSS